MNDEGASWNPRIDTLIRQGRVVDALGQPMRPPGSRTDTLARWFGVEGAEEGRVEVGAYAGLTLGDLVYDFVRTDPRAVEAIDFASQQDFEGLFSFARFAENRMAQTTGSLAGDVNRLQGYVAEQVLARNLEARGHDVTFPASANQKGFDILIDGEPCQVKCVMSPQAVREHLKAYPDIPVYVNREIATDVGDLPNVYVDPELSSESVRKMTEETLDHGAELIDFEVPWISLAVSSGAGIRDLYYGRSDLTGIITNVLTDTTGRIACGALGEWAGTILGLALFGPAGGIIGPGFGAILGAGVVGKPAARAVRGLLTRREEADVRDAVVRLAAEAESAMPAKLEAWGSKRVDLETAFEGDSGNRAEISRWVLARLDDDVAYFRNKQREFGEATRRAGAGGQPIEVSARLLTTIQRAGILPHRVQGGLKRLFESLASLEYKYRRFRLS